VEGSGITEIRVGSPCTMEGSVQRVHIRRPSSSERELD
jgi:hypothetical protein